MVSCVPVAARSMVKSLPFDAIALCPPMISGSHWKPKCTLGFGKARLTVGIRVGSWFDLQPNVLLRVFRCCDPGGHEQVPRLGELGDIALPHPGECELGADLPC